MLAAYSAEILFISRLLLGGAFVFAGVRNVLNADFLSGMMAARGVPQARVILWVGIVLQIAAGAMFVFGLKTGLAAALLMLFLLVATPMFHNFWDYQGPDRAARINGFVGNIALIGSFLFAAVASI